MAIRQQNGCAVVRIGAGGGYDVTIGRGLLERAATLVPHDARTRRVALVADDVTASLFLERARASFERAGLEVHPFVFPHGEASKNIRVYGELLEHLAQCHLTRSDVVAALGGGVVGDLAGFAAATYMRGCRFVQLPTTLLAAIDSSVGGKTGIDLAAGKNLAGAFYQPAAVICDIECLAQLPAREFANGLGEALKYGVLCDAELFAQLGEDARADLQGLAARCVDIKRRYVEADEREQGARQFLNLGHTFGHAIEKASGYTVPHGSAVAVGTVMASRYAVARGLADPGLPGRVAAAAAACGLSVETDLPREALAEAALSDKKRRGDTLTFVLPREVGACELVPVDVREVPAAFEAGIG